jgi:hypothetical protein
MFDDDDGGGTEGKDVPGVGEVSFFESATGWPTLT